MAEQIIRRPFRPYPRCYVYIHHDPRAVVLGTSERTDHVVYVGKGTRARAWVDTRGSSLDHRRWLRDLQILGFAPDEFVKIVKRKLTSEEASKFERELIAFHRNNGATLFNKERGWKGAVRKYGNASAPEHEFGKLVGIGRKQKAAETQGAAKAFTEDDFKSRSTRSEDDATITYDFRSFEDQQLDAVAWYLGFLVFRVSVGSIKIPSKDVVLMVDTRFEITRQLEKFVKKLKASRLPIEIRYMSRMPAEQGW
jgi:hypothetical protein